MGVLTLLGYLAQVPSVSSDKDGSELTLVLATLGVAHPTGYPLWTLLGHLFAAAVHALGATWPWAANAWSAVGGAVGVAFLHALILELLPTGVTTTERGRAALALLPTAVFALDPIWTHEATLAEVYSWHLAWTTATSWLFVRTLRGLQDEGRPWGIAERRRAAALWGAAAGLGLAHHATSVLTSLPLTAALLWAARRRGGLGPREIALGLAAAAVPLVSYVFVFVRAAHPAAYQWPDLEPGLGPAWAHLTGSVYRGYLGHFAPSPEQREMLGAWVYPVLGPCLLLSGLGWFAVRGPDERWQLGSLWAAAALGAVFAFSYGVPDPSSYFMAPMALACAGLSGLPALSPSPAVTRTAALAAGGGLLWLGVSWFGTGLVRKATFTAYDAELHAHWDSIPTEEGFVLWPNDGYVRFREYQLLRGEKPRLEVVNPAFLIRSPGRERFQARHGIDPAEGLGRWQPPPGYPVVVDRSEDLVTEQVGRWINGRSPLPVVLLDLRAQSLRQLRKAQP